AGAGKRVAAQSTRIGRRGVILRAHCLAGDLISLPTEWSTSAQVMSRGAIPLGRQHYPTAWAGELAPAGRTTAIKLYGSRPGNPAATRSTHPACGRIATG